MTLNEQIEFYEREYKTAKTRTMALVAFGAYMASKQARPSPIRPMHSSMRSSMLSARPPAGMTALALPGDLKNDITSIALSIFTDTVNAGKTFQDSILAVYLSGIDHGRGEQ